MVFCVSQTCLLVISDHSSVRSAAAELFTIEANLTELVKASNKLTEERDLLNANLTEMTEERNRLQSLFRQSKCRRAGVHFQEVRDVAHNIIDARKK